MARQREQHVQDQIKKVADTIHEYESILVGVTLKMVGSAWGLHDGTIWRRAFELQANTVPLERVSAGMPWARNQQIAIRNALVSNQEQQIKLYAAIEAQEERMVG